MYGRLSDVGRTLAILVVLLGVGMANADNRYAITTIDEEDRNNPVLLYHLDEPWVPKHASWALLNISGQTVVNVTEFPYMVYLPHGEGLSAIYRLSGTALAINKSEGVEQYSRGLYGPFGGERYYYGCASDLQIRDNTSLVVSKTLEVRNGSKIILSGYVEMLNSCAWHLSHQNYTRHEDNSSTTSQSSSLTTETDLTKTDSVTADSNVSKSVGTFTTSPIVVEPWWFAAGAGGVGVIALAARRISK